MKPVGSFNHRRTQSSTDLFQQIPGTHTSKPTLNYGHAKKKSQLVAAASNNLPRPNNQPTTHMPPSLKISNNGNTFKKQAAAPVVLPRHRRAYSVTLNSPPPVYPPSLASPKQSNLDRLKIKRRQKSATSSTVKDQPSKLYFCAKPQSNSGVTRQKSSSNYNNSNSSKRDEGKSLLELIEASTILAPQKVTNVETLEVDSTSYQDFLHDLNNAAGAGFRFGKNKDTNKPKFKTPTNLRVADQKTVQSAYMINKPGYIEEEGLFTITQCMDLKDVSSHSIANNSTINTTATTHKSKEVQIRPYPKGTNPQLILSNSMYTQEPFSKKPQPFGATSPRFSKNKKQPIKTNTTFMQSQQYKPVVRTLGKTSSTSSLKTSSMGTLNKVSKLSANLVIGSKPSNVPSIKVSALAPKKKL